MTNEYREDLMSEYRDEGDGGRCYCAGCASDWQEQAEAEMQQEYMVTVVFDVVGAQSAEDAAVIVRDALRMREGDHFRAALTQVNSATRFVESWWFPETSDKHVDGNDRPAATLAFDDE